MSSNSRSIPPDMDQSTDFSVGKSYAVSGKIMLSAIVILFFVVILMVFLHLYARWYLLRARRRHIRRVRNRAASRSHIVFHSDSPPTIREAPRGLDPAVLQSLPIFAYSSDTHPDPIDCAVCLSEFEEGEAGRTLPKCNHNFHIECIDMWFQTHSTCPLCRAPVEEPENLTRLVGVVGAEPGSSSSGLCATCEEQVAGPSAGSRKPMGLLGITVEVPPRGPNLGFEDESGTESTPSHYRSPVGRMLSFTRILSWERRPVTPPSSTGCEGGGSVDIERGREETVPEATRETRIGGATRLNS